MTTTPQRRLACLLAAVTLVGWGLGTHAEVIEKSGTFAGLKVTYKVVLPAKYDSSKAYPAILVFTGGSQDMRGVERAVESNWRAEAERRGYLVVSPASPNGSLFFQEADRIFPSFIDDFLREYKVAGKLHVAGLSNGGLSAFHVAARHPQYFSTVTGYPGLLDGPDEARAAAIKSMCIYMHVGERDTGWRSAMQEQSNVLRGRGYDVRFAIEPNEDHIIRAPDLGTRLFNELESCKR